MPANDGRHVPSHHHARTISAGAAAIITLALPSQQITVVHRSDGSGTTYIFSSYLSSVDPAWAAKVGRGTTLHWPAGIGVEGNPGVAEAVAHIPFSVGYIERSYSKGPALFEAAIRNRAGNYVTPTAASIAAGAAQKSDITPTDFSIVNEPGADSYPISGYSWALIYTHRPARPPARHWSISWTGSPTAPRPTPPPPATCPCRPRSSNSPAACSSR